MTQAQRQRQRGKEWYSVRVFRVRRARRTDEGGSPGGWREVRRIPIPSRRKGLECYRLALQVAARRKYAVILHRTPDGRMVKMPAPRAYSGELLAPPPDWE